MLADRQALPEQGAYYFRRDRFGFRRVVAIQADLGGAAQVTYHDGAREQTVLLAEWHAWVELYGAAPDEFVMMCAALERA